MNTLYSRRAVLSRIGLGGVAAALSPLGGVKHAFAQLDDRPWYFLQDAEARWLAAVCDVLIPEDDYPSASQAGVVDFIDFQLATDYGVGNGMYMQAPFVEGASQQGYQFPYPPSELFRRAIAALREEGETISDLNEAGRRDAVRRLSEREDMLTEDISATGFFDELWKLTNEGYFSDPIYLGNRDYAGWEMVGFPGAHAYYLHSVDAHNRPYPAPPMGIAHDPARRSTLPRLVGREG